MSLAQSTMAGRGGEGTLQGGGGGGGGRGRASARRQRPLSGRSLFRLMPFVNTSLL